MPKVPVSPRNNASLAEPGIAASGCNDDQRSGYAVTLWLTGEMPGLRWYSQARSEPAPRRTREPEPTEKPQEGAASSASLWARAESREQAALRQLRSAGSRISALPSYCRQKTT